MSFIHSNQQLETTQVSISRRMDVICDVSKYGMLYSSQCELNICKRSNMGDSHRHPVEWKNPETNVPTTWIRFCGGQGQAKGTEVDNRQKLGHLWRRAGVKWSQSTPRSGFAVTYTFQAERTEEWNHEVETETVTVGPEACLAVGGRGCLQQMVEWHVGLCRLHTHPKHAAWTLFLGGNLEITFSSSKYKVLKGHVHRRSSSAYRGISCRNTCSQRHITRTLGAALCVTLPSLERN